jgi:hypothetical protein
MQVDLERLARHPGGSPLVMVGHVLIMSGILNGTISVSSSFSRHFVLRRCLEPEKKSSVKQGMVSTTSNPASKETIPTHDYHPKIQTCFQETAKYRGGYWICSPATRTQPRHKRRVQMHRENALRIERERQHTAHSEADPIIAATCCYSDSLASLLVGSGACLAFPT